MSTTNQSKADAAIRVTKANATAIAKRLHTHLKSDHAWKGSYQQALVLTAKSLGWRTQEALTANYLPVTPEQPESLPADSFDAATEAYRALAQDFVTKLRDSTVNELVKRAFPKAGDGPGFAIIRDAAVATVLDALEQRLAAQPRAVEAIRFSAAEWHDDGKKLNERRAAAMIMAQAYQIAQNCWNDALSAIDELEAMSEINLAEKLVGPYRRQVAQRLMDAAMAVVPDELKTADDLDLSTWLDNDMIVKATEDAANYLKVELDLQEAIRAFREDWREFEDEPNHICAAKVIVTQAVNVVQYSKAYRVSPQLYRIILERLKEAEGIDNQDMARRKRLEHYMSSDQLYHALPKLRVDPSRPATGDLPEIQKALDELTEDIMAACAKSSAPAVLEALIAAADKMTLTYCATDYPSDSIASALYKGEDFDKKPYMRATWILRQLFINDPDLIDIVKEQSTHWTGSHKADQPYNAAHAVVMAVRKKYAPDHP